jgi:hypothetical protein
LAGSENPLTISEDGRGQSDRLCYASGTEAGERKVILRHQVAGLIWLEDSLEVGEDGLVQGDCIR